MYYFFLSFKKTVPEDDGAGMTCDAVTNTFSKSAVLDPMNSPKRIDYIMYRYNTGKIQIYL